MHYVNAAGYWLLMMDTAQKVAFEDGTDEEEMICRMAFSVVFGLIAKRVLTIRMDYYHMAVRNGATFAAQMAKAVEMPVSEVESSEFSAATAEYQKALIQQVVKLTAKNEAARTVKVTEEGGSRSAAGKP